MPSDAQAAASATPAATPSSVLEAAAAAYQPPAATPPAAPAAATPAAAAAPAPTWRDTLPDDLKADVGLEKFDKVPENERLATIARSYVNAQKMIGGDKLPKPKGADDTEALNEIYTALGRPAKADDYKLTRPADLPEGLTIDEDGEKFLKDFAHANGWNQKQLDNAYKAFFEREGKRLQEGARISKMSYDDCSRALQATGNAPAIMNAAGATVRNYGTPEVVNKLKSAGLDNDPVMVQFFARIGEDLIGHSVLKGKGGETMATAANIDQQIELHRTQYNDALYNAAHPNHKAATDKLSQLYEQRHQARTGAQ